jgi:hypothetical protein
MIRHYTIQKDKWEKEYYKFYNILIFIYSIDVNDINIRIKTIYYNLTV